MSRSYLARPFAGAIYPLSPDGRWRPRDGFNPPVLSGVDVDPATADRLTAVFACLRVITESAAMLPLHLYHRLVKGGKERATDHPVYRVINRRPNPWQTAFEFWEMYLGHLVLRGEAFAQKVYTVGGELQALIPLNPARIVPWIFPDSSFVYRYQPRVGPSRDFQPDELMRTLAFSRDGVTGRSMIEVCREAVGIGLAAEQFGASFLGKGVAPAGVLRHPGKLQGPARDKLIEQINAQRSGTANAGKTLVLEEGMDWTQVGMKLTDAQYIEMRRFSVTEMARLFRVPPHKIADLTQSTNNNIEHQGIEWVTDGLMPWLRRLEQTISRDLLLEDEQEGFFAEFLVNALLRGDIQSRYAAYAVARQWGWLNVDEIRERENDNPLPNGEGQQYLVPLNMVPADQPAPPGRTLPAPSNGSQAQGGAADGAQADLAPVLTTAFRDPLHRLARREAAMCREAFKKRGMPGILGSYEGHDEAMVRALLPVATSMAHLIIDLTQRAGPSSTTLQAWLQRMAEIYIEARCREWRLYVDPASTMDGALTNLEATIPDLMAPRFAASFLQLLHGAAAALAA